MGRWKKARRRRWTVRWLVWGGILGLAVALFVVMAIRAAQGEASLVISPASKDFGDIGRLQGAVSAAFQVESQGTAPLRIRRIITS